MTHISLKNCSFVSIRNNELTSMQTLPLSTYNFERIITENQLYIDKTKQMYSLMNFSHMVFLSRPRRFGKSLLLSTYASKPQNINTNKTQQKISHQARRPFIFLRHPLTKKQGK